MVPVAKKKLDCRDLPEQIDYYTILPDGSVVSAYRAGADVYIDEFDVKYFSDTDTMLYVRQHFGARIGVMRDIKYHVRSREFKTPKMLLGVVRGIPKET